MTGLLRAQQIACATDLQVTHCDLEAGTKLGKIPDGGKTLFGNLGQRFVRTIGKIGIGVPCGATNTTTQLMQLAKTKTVRILDDQGVGVCCSSAVW